ncbi:MAG TPA: UDP-N-acetylmuramate dehydrogenase [Phycisphaerae bacterium]|nr:UDP-N-acetylmuramate dehydrogenase [Phycisphaerae bacterium]
MNWYEEFGEQVRLNVPLAPLTWFGVGGPAAYLITPRDVPQLQAIAARLREKEIPVYVLGAGANLLVHDEGVNGAVICLNSPEFKKAEVPAGAAAGSGPVTVSAGAGKDVQKLVLECAHAGYSGLECLAGIPGSVGGELRMNAGGAFGDIGSAVQSVTVMDTNGQVFTRLKEDLVFEYRKSNIAAKFILAGSFTLTPDDPQRVANKVKEIWMFKKNSQPLADHSAGCIFKNPRGLSAGALIDQAGLKGTIVGGAEVSSKHANFITAKKGSRATDILSLIEQVRGRVKDKFDVNLETEVVIW